MQRSGSTWLYNPVRLLLCSNAVIESDFCCGWLDDQAHLSEARYRLLKVHEFDGDLAEKSNRIFYSYRDIRDVVASSKRKFNYEPSIGMVDHLIATHARWEVVADYVMSLRRYSTISLVSCEG